MQKLICPPPIGVETIVYKWVERKIKIQKLKTKIAECVKSNKMEDAQKYASELEMVEKSPLVTYPNPYIYY